MLKIKSVKTVLFENEFEIDAENSAMAVCALNGEGTFENGVIKAGDCLVVPKGYKSAVYAQGSMSFACFELEGYDGEKYISVHTDRAEIIELLAKLAQKTTENDVAVLDGISIIFKSVVNLKNEETSVGNKYVDMAKRYIDTNYGKQIKIEDIAGYVGTDRKYLRNLFFKYLGTSTKDYLTNLRIEKAKVLLEDNSVAVSEISASVGYPDALAFSKIFKKQTGLSPSDYRNGVAPKKEEKEEAQLPKEDIKYFLL